MVHSPARQGGAMGNGCVMVHGPARKGGANGERGADYCIADYCIRRRRTSYNAWVHAVIPNPRTRYNAEKNSPATIRNANE